MIHVIMHTAHRLAHDIAQKRCYMNSAFFGFEYDPRFLVFEFLSTFLLRERQVNIKKNLNFFFENFYNEN
jgi:hypothetical protein